MSNSKSVCATMNSAPTAAEQNGSRPITGDELALMGDLGPCELVAGRIVPMSPTNWRHGDYVGEITETLRAFAKKHKLGKVLAGEVGIYTRRDPDTVRAADVAFISKERLAQVASEIFLDVAPELIVEVNSPGNTWQEMRQKIDEYFAIGVERVWLVEPARRQVLVYRAPTDLVALDEAELLQGEGVLEGFSRSVSELFA